MGQQEGQNAMTKMLVLGSLTAVAGLSAAGTVRADEGYCREYQQKVTIGGAVRETYGTACMQPDGSWQVVGGDADLAAQDLAQQLQVANVAPAPIYKPVYAAPVVYEEPIYSNYQYYPGPSWGLSLGWSDRDRHGGWRGDRGGHGGHGHGRH